MGVTLHIVPHTHWDREWYEPFEVFRLRLVELVDDLLDLLAAEPGFRFHLDGQTAALDDYLAVRPERAVDIERFARRGRLDLGPWATLPDEFLVSGETLVRDLTAGMARASPFGGLVPIGYLPDSFGHTAQMPQILRLCGLDRALLWRGVPSTIDRTVFSWRALDGSTVRTGYLCSSYSNAAALPLDPDRLLTRAHALVREQDAFSPGGHVLAMNGTDHRPPQTGLAATVEAANALEGERAEAGAGLRLRIGSIVDWFDSVDAALGDTPLPEASGELRSGARSNVLMGVTSTRTDLKRLRSRAERTLERLAEPLSIVTGQHLAQPLLDAAWRNLVLNAAHDSVCACSSDATMADVEGRDRRALEIADGLLTNGMAGLASRIWAPRVALPPEPSTDRPGAGDLPDPADAAPHGLVLWNPAGVARDGVCEIDLPVGHITGPIALETPEGDRVPCIVRDRVGALVAESDHDTTAVHEIVSAVRGRRVHGMCVNTVFVSDPFAGGNGIETVDVVLGVSENLHGHVDADLVAARLERLSDGDGRTFHVTALRRSMARLAFRTPRLPPLGWTTLAPVEAGDTVDADGPGPSLTPVTAEGRVIDNGIVRVAADVATGTFTVRGLDGVEVPGLGGLEDVGDAGDTYNFSPPEGDRPITEPTSVDVAVLESTPLAATLRSTRVLRAPLALAEDETRRTAETVDMRVVTDVTVEAACSIVRVDVRFENTVRDHRLRLVLPLPGRARASSAGVAFGAIERGLETEGSEQEYPLPTWPSHDFVRCETEGGGLAVLLDQITEYEVVRDGAALALTLVRATGRLARPAPRFRPNPAGPDLHVEHAQSPGPQRFRCGLVLHRQPLSDAEASAFAEEFALPVQLATKRPTPTPPAPPTGGNQPPQTHAIPARTGGVPAVGGGPAVVGGPAPAGKLAPAGAPLQVEGKPPIRITALTRRNGDVDLRFVNFADTESVVPIGLAGPVVAANDLDPVPAVVDLLGNPIATEDGATEVGEPLRPWEIRTIRWRSRGGEHESPAT